MSENGRSGDPARDEKVSIGLPFEEALRALLKVDPDSAAEDEGDNSKPETRPAKPRKK